MRAENENLKANQQILFSSRIFGEAEPDIAAEDIASPVSAKGALDQAANK